ncbi:1-aminocyclopropane-1-carboxylate deaminase/D-cysteine desulfhydrase [Stutzerimonas azotifigens]|uniref:Pyridoxal-phosphate dependent enzyme n=1 Tax=Stutzerimonas azotifigens TaxID=291995 RepID=A0ABR5Z2Z2_9GAMM|nr:pyridoxal-phosphate dependent enzyme [Stutzerimonas azotifigens]MBA1274581.1 pyridoxal-phosphate dependent enzyme [Stutzerimonas azotifigens]
MLEALVLEPGWAPLQRLDLDWARRAGVELAVLRLDLVDPQLSGNKWFKLSHHLRAAAASGASGLLSLGGAHSNHLHALAAAGCRFGYATVGLLRGHPVETPTVADLRRFGMELHWLGYDGYRQRHRPDFWAPWLERHPGHYPIPEGGGGLAGALGCAGMVEQVRGQLGEVGFGEYDGWWLAAGTGTTLAGLAIAEAGQRAVYGALAGPPSHRVAAEIDSLLAQAGQASHPYRLVDASRDGFGRFDETLARFLFETERDSGLPLEPVYTAKALLALRTFLQEGGLERGTRLVFVHTGGLQGRRAAEAELRRLGT